MCREGRWREIDREVGRHQCGRDGDRFSFGVLAKRGGDVCVLAKPMEHVATRQANFLAAPVLTRRGSRNWRNSKCSGLGLQVTGPLNDRHEAGVLLLLLLLLLLH